MSVMQEQDYEALRAQAAQVLSNAYAPYSRFHVAAAVRDERGEVFVGVNVENASYGLTVCAERNAIAAAITQGAKRIEAIVILCNGDAIPMPCGACRQVICELSGDCMVRAYAGDGSVHTFKADALLPERFRFTP
jgi:cytidine deaminase